ncbi:MAG: glutamyl-tRNA reductase [Lentisphaerae bacterium]|nr:glutamyl-tRNA reductase [Lentisphaerota bacterium]
MMTATTIICLGLSHRTAPVALREKLSCSLADCEPSFAALSSLRELAVVSTCNRIELYAVVSASVTCPRTDLLKLMSDVSGVPLDAFSEHTYTLADREAIEHLLRVAAGLESLVLGESQVQGQITDAYMTAVAAGTVSAILGGLFKAAIRTGKRARTETAISSNPASVSSVAIAMLKRTTGDLHDKHAAVLGAGQMGRLAQKALHSRGARSVAMINRTLLKAEEAVAGSEGLAYGLEGLSRAIAAADVLITAAHTPTPIVNAACVAGRDRPLVIVDLAVPRNVHSDVAALPHVHLFDVDDLQATLDESLAARQCEVPRVEAIIATEIERFNGHLRELAMKPIIIDMRRKADELREAELARTLNQIGDVDPDTLAHIQHFSRSLVNRLLHEPTVRLKAKATACEADGYAATVRDLFGLAEAAT